MRAFDVQVADIRDKLATAAKELAAPSPRVRRALALVRSAEDRLADLEPVMSVVRAAEELGVTRPTVYSWVRTGVLEPAQSGGITVRSVDALRREFEELRRLPNAGSKQRRLATLAATSAFASDRKTTGQIHRSLAAFASRTGIVRE